MTFSGGLTIHQGDREICMIELGPGHSESDVIIHLPDEGIVFCGDLFMNGLPPMPAEGCASAAIASIRKIEDLDARIYVPGHGKPGTRKDVEEQRLLLERLIRLSRGCFEKGLSFDEAVENVAVGAMPPEFVMPVLISCYCELAGKMPESRRQGATNHMQVLSDLARRAEILFKNSQSKPE
jgi:glyoxylase-like metal-dependent hydrolase (beta-lactamase superfamily II)